ncbi:hypothetical protein G9A89_004652 [Geosiphon pyriformis]|nr:hypothetical protein G9A89_004652 [Geosiphon pyriformis]
MATSGGDQSYLEEAMQIARETADTAKQKTQSIFGSLKGYAAPVTNSLNWIWETFPPLGWFLYGAGALNAIPVVIFLAYLAVTTLICFGIAGGFIFFVEGFFILLGCGVVLPVIGFAIFSGCVAFAFVMLGYGCFETLKLIGTVIRYLYQEVEVDTLGVTKGLGRALSRTREAGRLRNDNGH